MTESRLTVVGRVLRHAMGVLLLCWLRALKWGAIAGIAGVLATEVAAVILSGTFPPDGLAQVVAFTLGAALAFGAAATIIIDELVVGIGETIRVLAGEAEAGARAAAMAARRDVGESTGRVLALFGLGGVAAVGAARRPTTPDALPAPAHNAVGPRDEVGPRLQAMRARVPVPSVARTASPEATPENPWAATLTPVSEWPAQQHDAAAGAAASPQPESIAGQTLVDVAGLAGIAGAVGAQGKANPSTRPLAQPVHATNLPRIDWAAEDLPGAVPELAAAEREGRFDAYGAPSATTQPLADASPPAGDAAPALAEPAVWHIHETMPAMPERWHDPAQYAEPEPEEPGITPVDLFGAPPPAPAPPAPAPPAPAPPAPAPPAPLEPPVADTVAREPDSSTRPLPEKTRPLGAGDLAGQPRGSVWDHISQVLAGRPVPPIPTEDDAAFGEPAEGNPSPPGGSY